MEVDPRDHRDKEEKIASISPWKRKRPESRGLYYKITVHSFWEKFDDYTYANMDLDIDTKKTALKASPSVVSVVSLTGGNALFMGSGTIIDCENVNGTYFSTILTSASLLRSSAELEAVPEDIKIDVYVSDGKLFEGRVFAYDFHFNIAFIKIESNATLPTASLRLLEDSISIDPNDIPGSDSFQLRPHSNVSKLCPGDIVVAVGRFFDAPYNLMAARGQFSLDCCKFDCKELFRANCKISKCGIGGPLINHYGEVIGVNFYDSLCTPFLPINIVSKCLEHFKKYGNFCRPWLGMEMTNLYAASVDKLERIIQKFPNIVKGVLVEKVIKESPAEHAGICQGDVIVRCSENFVQSILEFYGIIWDKVGKSVEVVVIRERSDALLNLTMVVDETSADKFNRWPLPKRSMAHVGRIRGR
ncbi:putative protease Do-like 14 [Camellia lanceoleosa]|uniref:Protease Do-like 14 n=1 Tax=Camellia lanceoleosa TaxID=1840588 RepID=A0ACC0I8A3_9ERIC|nr:putative protease Do-like 14 [Camellia lanceoleosa]